MIINELLYNLLYHFNKNWEQNKNKLYLELSKQEIGNIEDHPLCGELKKRLF